jgi:hypothetical protein
MRKHQLTNSCHQFFRGYLEGENPVAYLLSDETETKFFICCTNRVVKSLILSGLYMTEIVTDLTARQKKNVQELFVLSDSTIYDSDLIGAIDIVAYTPQEAST